SLTVRNGADGAVLGDDSFAGPNPKKIAAAVGSRFWRQLGPAVRQGKPPTGAKTKAAIAEEAPPPPDEAAEEAPAGAPPAAEERPRKKSRRAAESEAEAASAAAPDADISRSKAKPAAAEGGGPKGALPALTLGIGANGMNRSLSWHQDNNALAPYS